MPTAARRCIRSPGGVDAAKFTIDASTGALAFIAAPDYEAPTDSGADNVYNVTVQVSDGAGGSDTQAIAVTVTDVAATLVVDTASDNNDSGITAGNAAHTAEWLNAQPGADGKVSLREAILAANNTAGVDTISFSIAAGGVQTIALTTQLPEITDAVVIDGSTQSGYAGTPLIVLDGSSAPIAANGLSISAGGSTVRGLGIQNFGHYGIYLTSGGGNLIEGNHIGINAAGSTAAGNGFGIVVSGSAGNTIGGTTTAARNLISGNSQIGIRITGAAATGNTVAGNYVGLNAAGTAAVANGEIGINIEAGASNNTIGGATTASRNVVSGNVQYGVCISDAATSHNTVQNNYLGTNAAGNAAISNGGFGLVIDFGAAHTSVLDNVISGNTHASWSAFRGGIYLSGNSSTIQGNIIGLDATGTTALGNGGGASSAGIYEVGTSLGVLIGGTSAGQGNLIAGNTGAGVIVKATGNVQVLGNSIYGNSGLGIDLGNDGVTANDAAPDADSGANGLQNFPVLSSAATNGSQIHIAGTLASAANSWFRVEFFASGTADASGYGEGQRSIGYANVATDASGQATVSAVLTASVAAGEFVTATATRSDASYATFTDTSEFSATVTTTSNVAPVNTLPGAQTVNEDAVLAIGGVSVGDGNGNLASTQLSVVQGTLSVTLAGGATISAGANGTATLTLSGTQAQINAALASLTYQGAAHFNGSDTRHGDVQRCAGPDRQRRPGHHGHGGQRRAFVEHVDRAAVDHRGCGQPCGLPGLAAGQPCHGPGRRCTAGHCGHRGGQQPRHLAVHPGRQQLGRHRIGVGQQRTAAAFGRHGAHPLRARSRLERLDRPVQLPGLGPDRRRRRRAGRCHGQRRQHGLQQRPERLFARGHG